MEVQFIEMVLLEKY